MTVISPPRPRRRQASPQAATILTVTSDATRPDTGDTAGDRAGITLAEWAPTIGRSETYVRNFWRPLPGFPAPLRRRPTSAPGPGPEEYNPAELARFLTELQEQRPRLGADPFPIPSGDPNERLTLGAIARRLGVAERNITQYRQAIEEHITPEIRGKRAFYPLAQTVTALNTIRRGPGIARDPDRDRRRKDT